MIEFSKNVLDIKYNVSIPRYTSYPPVPNWEFYEDLKIEWPEHLKVQYEVHNSLALYIHLPYCEKLCTYCGCNKRITTNHKVELPYIQTVLEEWKLYKKILGKDKINIKELHLGGGTPTFFSPENLDLLLSEILKDQSYEKETFFSFEAHPNSTTKEHLEVFRKYNFDRISIGVQDISDDIMKVINREQTIDQIEMIVNESRALGYSSINFDLVYGLPFQTIDHIVQTMCFLEKFMPDRIAYYSYAHVPWKSKGQRKYEDEDVPKGNDKKKLKEFGYAYLSKLGYERLGMDHFCLKQDRLFSLSEENRMSRNFMGYTDSESAILLGLGTSSISSTPSFFVQNNKVIEDYSEMIFQGILPIENGHKLTELEVRLAQHINNIMCNLSTKFDSSELDEFLFLSAMPQLLDMEADGLLILESSNITVTDLGKDYLRNICVAFDVKFINTIEPKYSMAD